MTPPIDSPELVAIKSYMDSQGVAYKITSTDEGHKGDGVHASNSLHYAKRAMDIAGMSPSVDSPILMAIYQLWTPVEGQLSELIYARAPYCIKDGRRVNGLAFYGAATMSIHHNHVHVGVPLGWRWTPVAPPTPPPKVRPMFVPALVMEPIVAQLQAPAGGVWLLSETGAVYSMGTAQYHGGANGQAYFAGRKAARLEPLGDGYTIVAETGERYDYP